MLNAMLSYLIYFPAAILCLLPMRNQLKHGLFRTAVTCLIALVLIIPAAAWLDVRFSLGSNVLTAPLLAAFFALYHCSLKGSLPKSLAVFLSVVALLSILSNFASCFDAARHPLLGADSYTPDYSLFQSAAGTAAVILFFYPLWKYGSRLVDRLTLNRIWLWTMPFSLVLLGINLYLRPVKYETLHVNRVATAVLMVLFGLLLIWTLMQITFYFIVIEILNAAESETRLKLLSLQESQFQTQQLYMESSARARHDFRQNIRTLTGLYDKGEYEALGEYLHTYEQSLPQNDVTHFCDNTALNALLNYYTHTASEEGDDFTLHVDLPSQIAVPDLDLCILVGNLLENALIACRYAQEKKIDLRFVTKHDTMLYILVTNSFDGQVRQEDGKYSSIRRNGFGRGLESIREIAERYGGTAQFSHEGNRFYSNASLKIR